MILRDDQGGVIMAACRTLEGCLDATEAELAAIEEGLKLAMQWYPGKFSLETDSTDAAELIKQNTPNASAYAFRINAIRELIRERDCNVYRISRDANSASHELAKLGRVQGRSQLWLHACPPELAETIAKDCNIPSV
jgi:ribonuclease HI